MPKRRTFEEATELGFWPKVDTSAGPDGCWPWLGSRDSQNYGHFRFVRDDGSAIHMAYRFAYELAYGRPPEGKQIDHTCHSFSDCPGGDDCPHRACVNPAHLEAVTCRENLLRGRTLQAANAEKVVCIHGHTFTPENTFIDGRGMRQCLTCRRARDREYKWQKRREEGKPIRKELAELG